MPTRWNGASAVSTQDHLIVSGGFNKGGYLNTVEVFDGQQWVTADPLPKSCGYMKSTSHDGHYYLMGGQWQVPLCSTLPCSPLLTRLPSILPPHPPTLTSPQSGRHSQTPHTSAPALPYLEGHWWLLVASTTNPPYTSTPLSPSHGCQLGRCLWECTKSSLSHCPMER